MPLQEAGSQPLGSAHLHLVGKSGAEKRQLRILIADDNQDAAHALSELLQACGHITQVAHDGRQAVDVAETFGPDVALLDIGMPHMNGYEAARAIRKHPELQAMVLVALTGWGANRTGPSHGRRASIIT